MPTPAKDADLLSTVDAARLPDMHPVRRAENKVCKLTAHAVCTAVCFSLRSACHSCVHSIASRITRKVESFTRDRNTCCAPGHDGRPWLQESC